MKKSSQKAGGCNARKSLKGGNPSKKAGQKAGGCGARKALKGGSYQSSYGHHSSTTGTLAPRMPHTEAPESTRMPHAEAAHPTRMPHVEAAHPTRMPQPAFHRGGAKTKKATGAAKTIYCLKCKKQVEAKNITQITKKGKRVVKMETGTCPHCGNKVFKIVGGGKQ
jgi:hypothetical protein